MKTLQMSVALWNSFFFFFFSILWHPAWIGSCCFVFQALFSCIFLFFSNQFWLHSGERLHCFAPSAAPVHAPLLLWFCIPLWSELRAAPIAAVQVGCSTGTASAPCPAAGKRVPERSGSHCEHPLLCSICRMLMAAPLYGRRLCFKRSGFKRFTPKISNDFFFICIYRERERERKGPTFHVQ